MLSQSIIANALDLAGGELIKNALDANFATLAAMNVIDSMMLELSLSQKQKTGAKVNLSLSANTDTGTINLSSLSGDARFVRFRENVNAPWQLIDVVDEIEDLTRASNEQRKAILFQGLENPVTYFLSWVPTVAISAEIWGKTVFEGVSDLDAGPPFPPEFSTLAAYRTAEFCLNSLLLMDERKFASFVIAQKATLKTERDRCEYAWRMFRALPADSAAISKVRPYDAMQEDYDEADASLVINVL